jgi:hypothetical protein
VRLNLGLGLGTRYGLCAGSVVLRVLSLLLRLRHGMDGDVFEPPLTARLGTRWCECGRWLRWDACREGIQLSNGLIMMRRHEFVGVVTHSAKEDLSVVVESKDPSISHWYCLFDGLAR